MSSSAYLAHQGSIALPLLSMVRVDGTALVWTLLIAVGALFSSDWRRGCACRPAICRSC